MTGERLIFDRKRMKCVQTDRAKPSHRRASPISNHKSTWHHPGLLMPAFLPSSTINGGVTGQRRHHQLSPSSLSPS